MFQVMIRTQDDREVVGKCISGKDAADRQSSRKDS